MHINKKLYDIAVKASRETISGECDTCFCTLVGKYLEEQGLEYSFLEWKRINHVHTICSSLLFYLQDQGIIKILRGTTSRDSGVDCRHLKCIISKQGNKI